MILFLLPLLVLATPPAHYVKEWKSVRNDDCGRMLFLSQRLRQHQYAFTPQDLKRVEACEKKLFPTEALHARIPDRIVRISAHDILKSHATPERAFIPSGIWYIGFVPHLSDFARKLHGQLPDAPETDFSFGRIVRKDAFWIEAREHQAPHAAKPLVRVTFDEARAVCQKAGGDLPDEDQWEIAARGAAYYRPFSFGESLPAQCFGLDGETCGSRREAVDVSPWGVWLMGSGVAEWVRPSPSRPAIANGMAITRGGASQDPYFWNLVAVRRVVAAQTRSERIGFRCVFSASKPSATP